MNLQTSLSGVKKYLAEAQQTLSEKLPSREQLEQQFSTLGAQLDDLQSRVEKLSAAVAPSVRDLAGTLKDAAVSTAQQAAKEAPKHSKKIKKAACRAQRDAKRALAELAAEAKPEKKKRHTGLIVTLVLAGVAAAGLVITAVRSISLADEQWMGVDEDLAAEKQDAAEDTTAAEEK
ncbi:MAG: hypothetical protein LKF98_04055 [Microbacteriaceae bacterium]|jgi:hypothetical protein|nr:hypothetical protein [Microbacteriaceae bacterium]